MDEMKQTAPYPVFLDSLVRRLVYRPGWKFTLGHIDRTEKELSD